MLSNLHAPFSLFLIRAKQVYSTHALTTFTSCALHPGALCKSCPKTFHPTSPSFAEWNGMEQRRYALHPGLYIFISSKAQGARKAVRGLPKVNNLLPLTPPFTPWNAPFIYDNDVQSSIGKKRRVQRRDCRPFHFFLWPLGADPMHTRTHYLATEGIPGCIRCSWFFFWHLSWVKWYSPTPPPYTISFLRGW